MVLDLPQWTVWVVGAFVLIGAAGGVFVVVRVVAIMTKSYLLLISMTATLEKFDTLSSTLFELARQFKNDSGSSALDKIEQLQAAGVIQRADAAIIKAAVANVRAEQTQLALEQRRQPATTQTIHIGGDAVGHEKAIGADEVHRDKIGQDQIGGDKLAAGSKIEIEGTVSGKIKETPKE